MTAQSEYQLENELIGQLKQLGYASVTLKDESQLLSNLKTQVERANGLAPLSETEWKQVISFLNTGTVFERAKNLRDLFLSNLMMVQANTSFSCQMTQAKTSIRSPIKSRSTTATIMAVPAVLM
jgi:hypothetical protein